MKEVGRLLKNAKPKMILVSACCIIEAYALGVLLFAGGGYDRGGMVVKLFVEKMLLLSLCCISLNVAAETYKCKKGGQTIFSDVPCAPAASRVDTHSDAVSREQRRQAEIVNEHNRGQLSELEYRAARERNFRGGVYILGSDPVPPRSSTSSRRSR